MKTTLRLRSVSLLLALSSSLLASRSSAQTLDTTIINNIYNSFSHRWTAQLEQNVLLIMADSIELAQHTASAGGNVYYPGTGLTLTTYTFGISPSYLAGQIHDSSTNYVQRKDSNTNKAGYVTPAYYWANMSSGSGSVTSVAQTVPSWMSVSGSPITTSGTLAITTITQPIQKALMSGTTHQGNIAPYFRNIYASDLPPTVDTSIIVSIPTALFNSSNFSIVSSNNAGTGSISLAGVGVKKFFGGGTTNQSTAAPTFRYMYYSDINGYQDTTLASHSGSQYQLADYTGANSLGSIANSGTTGALLQSGTASAYPSYITTIGSNITWNGGVIAGSYGGTGVNNGAHTCTWNKNVTVICDSAVNLYGTPYFSSVSMPTLTAPAPGASGYVWTSNGTNSAPSWQAASGGGGGSTYYAGTGLTLTTYTFGLSTPVTIANGGMGGTHISTDSIGASDTTHCFINGNSQAIENDSTYYATSFSTTGGCSWGANVKVIYKNIADGQFVYTHYINKNSSKFCLLTFPSNSGGVQYIIAPGSTGGIVNSTAFTGNTFYMTLTSGNSHYQITTHRLGTTYLIGIVNYK